MIFPVSEPETFFRSSSVTNADTSDYSILPNFPSWPFNFRPVKVFWIFQNLMWPIPDEVRMMSSYLENLAWNTSRLLAFAFKTIYCFFQSQMVI